MTPDAIPDAAVEAFDKAGWPHCIGPMTPSSRALVVRGLRAALPHLVAAGDAEIARLEGALRLIATMPFAPAAGIARAALENSRGR